MTPVFFDFETRSSNPIRWGVDNYFARAEPLILTWAVDDGPVQIMDYSQEIIPRLPRVFREPGHTFIAHNCQFDRRVLERLFDLHRPIEDYRCTQAQAYAHGLPGSLETLGQVLGIKLQKLTGDDGHKLMLFFCTPRSILKDGSPKWNAPEDHPEKWEAFKRYAIRDTEALREVYRKLPTWNYQGENLQTWFLDQRINERGFGFDSQLAEAARKVLDAAKGTQQRRTRELTQDAVGSVTQREKLLAWFNASGLEITSMKASDVREALESDDLPPEHRMLLELRLEGSKSSGAKYRRGLDCVGPDGRLRDTMVYCGANRTGRFCLTGDHEVLTPKGWVALAQWRGGPIAVWRDGSYSFQNSKALGFDYSGDLLHLEGERHDQLSTPEHTMPLSVGGALAKLPVTAIVGKKGSGSSRIFFAGRLHTPPPRDSAQLRVLVMVQADGCFKADGGLSLRFRKTRKVERCRQLLRRAEIVFSEIARTDAVEFQVKERHLPLWLRMFKDKTFGPWLFDENPEVFFAELELWDSYRCGPKSIQYSTTNQANADTVQAFAALSGLYATKLERAARDGKWNKCYVVNIWLEPTETCSVPKPLTRTTHVGRVYCAETPTGFFLVRRNGRHWVTGNSGRTLQPQNLSRYSPQWEQLNKDAPHEPIEQIVLPAILRGDAATLETHGGVNTCCNDAIRSSIIAAPGNEFIAADWSNIEGRVLAWLADDWAQLEYFRAQDRGEAPDSYKFQWAQMFKIPVEQVTKNQRQASKQLKLACNYLGGVGALITMAMGNNLNLEDLMAGVLDQVPEDVKKKSRTAWRRAFLEGEDFDLAPWVYQSCDALVRLFRQANETVTKAGYGLGSVVLDAMKNPNTLFVALKCKVWYDGRTVIAQLPCGRRLFYWNPEVREEREIDELTGHEKLREVFYYRASRGKQWRRLRGWAGLYVENFTQAVANSVLRAGLLNVQRHYPGSPVLHVHDEVVCEAPAGTLAPEELERLLTSDLAARHPWMNGLPLAASAWRGVRYRK